MELKIIEFFNKNSFIANTNQPYGKIAWDVETTVVSQGQDDFDVLKLIE